MTHNDLRKGDKVVLSGLRFGTIMDNRRGIRRCVKIEERGGCYPDMGDVYVDEIHGWLPADKTFEECDMGSVVEVDQVVSMSPAHRKQMAKIRRGERDFAQFCADEWNRSCEI
jgi:hypothetical protein